MQRSARTVLVAVAAVTLLGACQQDDPWSTAVPEGYHRMPDGTLMENAAPADDSASAEGVGHEDHAAHGEDSGDGSGPDHDPTHEQAAGEQAGRTEYRSLGASGVPVAVHRSAETGEYVLGSAPAPGHGEHSGHGGHATPHEADFPAGVVPTRLRIPSLGVDAPVEAASLTPTIGVSDDPGSVSWLQETRRPGQLGPAVVGGRATIGGATTVLAGIRELVEGDTVVVVGDDGEEVPFVVEDVRSAPASGRSSIFAVVAGQSPELRLVAWDALPDGGDVIVRAVLDA